MYSIFKKSFHFSQYMYQQNFKMILVAIVLISFCAGSPIMPNNPKKYHDLDFQSQDNG